MNEKKWYIPPSVLDGLSCVPRDRAVALLLRHSVRGPLPPGSAGYAVPITDDGCRLALQLGAHLHGRLQRLHSSPLIRCTQTAQALRDGAESSAAIVEDHLLGNPGAFVLDGHRAMDNWEQLGHERVMAHLVSESDALPGMAEPDAAARFLVNHMLAVAGNEPGIHVFVTHDSLITATAARLLGEPLTNADWPKYLEGAFFWREATTVYTTYRGRTAARTGSLCGLSDDDIVAFARREIAATVGLDCGAHFFLAGGAFKSLLTGRPPRDLDVWAASDLDRSILLDVLRARGARPLAPREFAEAFELNGRIVEVPRKAEPPTMRDRLKRFDIALSAIGAEHRPHDDWSVIVDPLAHESVRRNEVLLLKPLVNWKYALSTLARMRRYADELGYAVPLEEESEIWRVFESQSPDVRAGMLDRYLRTCTDNGAIAKEAACRFP